MHLDIILKGHDYLVHCLELEFCKAVRKNINKFQKWSLQLPVDFNAWFKCIMNERRALPSLSLSHPVSSQSVLHVSISFSQPASGLHTQSSVLGHFLPVNKVDYLQSHNGMG